jgi:hypothetical protein
MSPDDETPGNGLLLFFRIDDYEMALKRARALVDRFEEEPHLNSEHSNNGVLTPGAGWILCHGQCGSLRNEAKVES